MNAAILSPRRRRRRFLVGYDEGDLPVKREPDEDIKDYAETTMNELLGWYGYEKVDSRDTQGLNLTHFASNNSNNNNNPSSNASPPSSAMEGSDASEDVLSPNEGMDVASRLRSGSISPGHDVSSTASDEVARQHQQMVSALSTITKHPGAPDSPNLPPGCIICAWCQKIGMKLFTLKTPNGCKAFCSELCFTQCRRASFKKNKICDWCKHVRHTVNYVDFQDGEQQLQFCSDKCLNQYKMNIFCKETQAHMQMHTHLKEAACKMNAAGSMNLITPELWLRDCKANGIPTSPHGSVDMVDDLNSEGSMSAVPSPSPVRESPLPPPLSPVKEKKEPKQEVPQKEKDKPQKKAITNHSSKRHSSDGKSKPHREKKVNGVTHCTENSTNPRRSPIQASPPFHLRNSSNQSMNGSHTLFPNPPMNPMSRPPQHVGFPPRHCPSVPPPPLNMSSMEHNRQPFNYRNMMPPPFQLLAQQQMEAFFRSQHGLDLRSKIPPPLPLPPWMVPPFPHPPQPPSHFPPPPSIVNTKSPSVPRSSPPSRNHPPILNQKVNHQHQNKLKHSKHSSVTTDYQPKRAIYPDLPFHLPSALPPVTVMVPFPLMMPIPLPIPVPIPIPPDIMAKYAKMKNSIRTPNPEKIGDKMNIKSEIHSNRKRKSSEELSKQKKKKRMSAKGSHKNDVSEKTTDMAKFAQEQKCYNAMEDLAFRMSSNIPVDFTHKPRSKPKIQPKTEAESRSHSPLSEAISSNEGNYGDRTSKSSARSDFSNINFSNFNLNIVRSSPLLLPQAAERHLQIKVDDNLMNCNSHSPTNLSVKDAHDLMSSNAINFKKKHLHDQLSLMT